MNCSTLEIKSDCSNAINLTCKMYVGCWDVDGLISGIKPLMKEQNENEGRNENHECLCMNSTFLVPFPPNFIQSNQTQH